MPEEERVRPGGGQAHTASHKSCSRRAEGCRRPRDGSSRPSQGGGQYRHLDGLPSCRGCPNAPGAGVSAVC
eukprot:4037681-Heterocapsa_arctica.AAC.1